MVEDELPAEAPARDRRRLQRLAPRGHRQLEAAPACTRCSCRRTAAPRDLPGALPAAAAGPHLRAQRRGAPPLVLPNRPWSHLSDHAPLAAELAL
jgi:endonuclease/exonuclease/phosphatase family metal-dependent hydrolase